MLVNATATDWWTTQVLAPWPYTPRALLAWTLPATMFIGYWCVNACLSVIYYFDLFPTLKIQAATKWPPRRLWLAAIANELVGTFVLQPLFGYYVLGAVIPERMIMEPIPSLWTFVWQIAVCFILADGVFYWTHRLLHTPALYGLAHKQHHEFNQTVGFALSYASPIEALVSNIPSTSAGPILLRPHLAVIAVYLILRYQESAEEHSGYRFPYSPWSLIRSNEHHDFHHSHNIGAYGTFPFWDWLCGTDKAYHQFKAKQKAKTLAATAAVTDPQDGTDKAYHEFKAKQKAKTLAATAAVTDPQEPAKTD